MRTERDNLLACIGYATVQAQPTRIIALTAALAAFIYQEGPGTRPPPLHQTAATTACNLRDHLGEADALYELGRIRYMTDDYQTATDLLERALTMRRNLGDRLGEADTLHELGRVRHVTGDYRAATDLLEQALTIHQDLGNHHSEAAILHELGGIRRETMKSQVGAILAVHGSDIPVAVRPWWYFENV